MTEQDIIKKVLENGRTMKEELLKIENLSREFKLESGTQKILNNE